MVPGTRYQHVGGSACFIRVSSFYHVPQSLRDILREPAAARRGPHRESVEDQAAASRRPRRLRAAGPLRDRLRVPDRPVRRVERAWRIRNATEAGEKIMVKTIVISGGGGGGGAVVNDVAAAVVVFLVLR